jgi:hypothetical protein
MRADDVTLGPVVKTPYRDGARWHLYADAVGIEMDVTRLVTSEASEFKL